MKFPVDATQRDVLRAFSKLGFVVVRKGNHIILERKNKDGSVTPLVLPNHRTIKSSTLRSILSQSGIERNEFIKVFYY
jgi:predicted RNA binding protein YcfA (HicA-like mRNA interferase family)